MDHTLEVPKHEGPIPSSHVGVHGDSIVVAKPKTEMTRVEALFHAAYLVAKADKSKNFTEFRGILKAVIESEAA